MNKLNGSRVYLIGGMDRASDGGVGWRDDISKFLHNRGCVVLNPCMKPIDVGQEDLKSRQDRQNLKESGHYEEFAKIMKLIRIVDLRMVDISDFMVVHLDLNVYACGSMEEIFLANRQKKPVLIHFEQGKSMCCDWLFGTIPHEHIFDSWSDLKIYIHLVDTGKDKRHFKRWCHFDYSKLTPQREKDNAIHTARAA